MIWFVRRRRLSHMNDRVPLCASLVLVVLFSALHPCPALAEQPQLLIEIQADENHPTYTVTNLSGKPITAYVTKNSRWDSVLSGESPIQSGAHLTQNLVHIVGSPLPDHIEVLAGIWVDGETFGQPEKVQAILDSRNKMALDYESAAKLLQQGLDENWNCNQYLEAVDRMPTSAATHGLKSTLTAAQKNSINEKQLGHLINTMLDTFIGKCARIRRAKPTTGSAS